MSPSLLSGAARLAGSSLLRLQSDERLVELARTGHDPAFGALVERYRAELLRYCERLVGPSRAEDVLQQALLNAHLAMPSLGDSPNVRAWLYRIAHNVAVNVLRAGRDTAILDDRAPAPEVLHEDLETRERLRAALEAIARLPQPQRDALTLRAIEGRSQEEIATALGVTPGAARQQIHRARATVRAAVSAITPYGLLVRFAMAGGGPPLSTGEMVAGAGAGTTVTATKVAATLLAAGAVAGGATSLPGHGVLSHRQHRAGSSATAPTRAAGAMTAVDHVAAAAAPGRREGQREGRRVRQDHGRRQSGDGRRLADHHGGDRHGSRDDGGRPALSDDGGRSGSNSGSGDSGSSGGSGEDHSGSGSGDGGLTSGGSGTTSGTSGDTGLSGRDSGSSGSSDGGSTSGGSTSGGSTSDGSSTTSGGSGSSDGGSTTSGSGGSGDRTTTTAQPMQYSTSGSGDGGSGSGSDLTHQDG